MRFMAKRIIALIICIPYLACYNDSREEISHQ